jgi:hypothetical protein
MSDSTLLRAFFARSARRLTWIAALNGAATGVAVALAVLLLVVVLAPPAGATAMIASLLSLGAVGALLRAGQAVRRQSLVPALIERIVPHSKNVLFTSAEILAARIPARPWVSQVVCRDAARIASQLDPARLFPARRTWLAFVAAIAAWILTFAATRSGAESAAFRSAAAVADPEITGVEIIVSPPAYSGIAAESLRDPVRVEVLEGSRIEIRVRASAATIALETLDSVWSVAGQQSVFAGELMAEQDDFIAIEPRTADGRTGERRLIGITVRADEPARVRVTSPGHDLFLPEATQTLDIEVQASDDLGLASLFLRFTKVSGSGEQFTFIDGELPLALARQDSRTWSGRLTLRLDTLGLERGDVLVYRGVAADRAPRHGETESDAFIVEITSPGAVASEGFAMDDEEDRYALSQQMVILKTERLMARSNGMPSDSMLYEARSLAAEQRSVRAEFVFMMGGELAEEVEQANLGDLNEEAHIEADDEAIAGRLENQGRFALIRAIRAMSRAYAALNEADLTAALAEEKLALDHLQNAFARTRYILRALTEREQIDLSRRLTGSLAEAGRDRRPAFVADEAEQLAVLRTALASMANVMADPEPGSSAAATVSRVAEQILRSDPSSGERQEISTLLLEAGTALRAGRATDARGILDDVTARISGLLRSRLPGTEGRFRSFQDLRLDGALTDALRRGTR